MEGQGEFFHIYPYALGETCPDTPFSAPYVVPEPSIPLYATFGPAPVFSQSPGEALWGLDTPSPNHFPNHVSGDGGNGRSQVTGL